MSKRGTYGYGVGWAGRYLRTCGLEPGLAPDIDALGVRLRQGGHVTVHNDGRREIAGLGAEGAADCDDSIERLDVLVLDPGVVEHQELRPESSHHRPIVDHLRSHKCQSGGRELPAG
jgi:hypothetical protein